MDAYGPDKYNRILAMVWDEQINVNLLMVAMGSAEVYRGAACQVDCRELEDAEAKAKRDRVAMWAQGASYESPRAFRISEESCCLPRRNAGRLLAARSGTAPGPTPWASPGR